MPLPFPPYPPSPSPLNTPLSPFVLINRRSRIFLFSTSIPKTKIPNPKSSLAMSSASADNPKPTAASKKKRGSLDPSPVAISEINQSDVETPAASKKKRGSPGPPPVGVSEIDLWDAKTLALKQQETKKSDGTSNGAAKLKKNIGLPKKKPAEFDPKSVATWEEGQRVPFAFPCLALDMIANETGKACRMTQVQIKKQY